MCVSSGVNNIVPSGVPCSKLSWKNTWNSSAPAGYYYKNKWIFLLCKHTQFRTKTQHVQCLRGRHIAFIGDSNCRSMVRILQNRLSLRTKTILKPGPWQQYIYADLESENISVVWAPHETPFYSWPFYNKDMVQHPSRYFTEMQPRNDSVILFHYWLHMARIPTNLFVARVQRLYDTITNILHSSPNVTIVIKGSHSISVRREIIPYDYINTQHHYIWNSIFEPLKDKVIFLNIWDQTVGIDNVHAHPADYVVGDQIDVLMSFLC